MIKRGHPWVFADALRHLPSAPAGTRATLLDHKKGRPIAIGFYHPQSPLAFRVCSPDPKEILNDGWAERQMTRAWSLRKTVIPADTTGFRLFNGEGDGLPGLICDVYNRSAVLQLDGEAAGGFWDIDGIADWVADRLSLQQVYFKSQSRSKIPGRLLVGHQLENPVQFSENGVKFTADIAHGQKTGFFLDQRLNRQQVGTIAAARSVLNVFGYTGGFSVYAGLGQAKRVTTVDLSAPALDGATHHWQLNGLPPTGHQAIKADAFSFLADAAKNKKTWNLVIVDPPSFTSAKNTVQKALSAYKSLIAAAADVTDKNGLLAAASCSSHIDLNAFLSVCEEGISKARRTATILSITGQPPDHPTPLVFSEFRYLKFILMRIE
jgi:23S rRNA (cytosine1962-C5)-methyltransferase